MKNFTLIGATLLVAIPAISLLPGCGGGNGLIGTPTATATTTATAKPTPKPTATTPVTKSSFNLTVTQSSGANFGASSFATSNVKVQGDSDNSHSSPGFIIRGTAASRSAFLSGHAVTSRSFTVGQSLTQSDFGLIFDPNSQTEYEWDNDPSNAATRGTIVVSAVSPAADGNGSNVTFQLTKVVLTPFPGTGATGTLTVNGTITATIPTVATNPIPINRTAR